MNRSALRLAAVFGSLVLSCMAAAGAEQTGEKSPRGEAEIDRLIRDLDSSEFTVREEATRKLAGKGAAAVAPLFKAAESESLEVRARAVSILQAIYIGGDSDDRAIDAAEVGLEMLAKSKDASVAGWAAGVLKRHYALREERAIAQIKKLGGAVRFVDPNNAAFVLPNAEHDPNRRIVEHIALDRKWKGGDEGLKYVKRLTGLPRLYIARNEKFSPISKKAQEQLQAALPNLDIQERGLACLGVGGSNHGPFPTGCFVSRLESEGAAEKGGVRVGDVITRFAGKKVDDFQKLIELIAEHDAGDKVAVEVYRGGREVTLEIKLGEWSN